MKIFIDFEATQPEQEIISIGAITEYGHTFYRLVKPQFSQVSKYITDMTHITTYDLENAIDLDTAFNELCEWCGNKEHEVIKWEFYSYGDGDVDFIKHSMCNIKSSKALIIASIMMATMTDYSKEVAEYFRGNVSLIKAFNYLKNLENKQQHNALEDAKMLADVFLKTAEKQPLEQNPFAERVISNYTFPSGKFYCKGLGKNAKEREFYNIHEAMEWLIETNINKEARDSVRRDKMATKIMKAIRKKDSYMNYKWRREI